MLKIQIIDNFFPDPYSIRSKALKAKNPNQYHNYPGQRFSIDSNLGDFVLSLIREYMPHAVISERDLHGMSFNFVDASNSLEYQEGLQTASLVH